MKRLFQTEVSEEYLNILLLVLRVSVAVLMIRHGFPKLTKLLEGGEIQFANPFAKKEMAILYLLFYITLLIAGSGKYSIDFFLTRKKTT